MFKFVFSIFSHKKKLIILNSKIITVAAAAVVIGCGSDSKLSTVWVETLDDSCKYIYKQQQIIGKV
jgi:hypothetical protein